MVCVVEGMFWLGIFINFMLQLHIDGLAQDCCNSIANTLGLLLSCTGPFIMITKCI